MRDSKTFTLQETKPSSGRELLEAFGLIFVFRLVHLMLNAVHPQDRGINQ